MHSVLESYFLLLQVEILFTLLQNLTLKSLSLLWDLFRDERLPVEVGDAALEAHFTVIESLGRSDALFKQYIDKCIEELLNDSGFFVCI